MAQTNALGSALANAISDSATTIELTSGGGLPTSDFIMVLTNLVADANTQGYLPTKEVIHVAARSGDVLSDVTRGYESSIGGGVAQAWDAGDKCFQLFTMGMINDALGAIPAHNSTTGKQGGTTGEYYHLTAAQATALDGIIAGGGDNAYWNAKAKGVPTMLYPPLTDDGDLITWLTNHPKWKQCDGTNGTPNLVDRFIIGSSVGLETTSITGSPTTIGGRKDAIVVSHAHTASQAAHNHTGSTFKNLLKDPYSGSLTGNDYVGSGTEMPVGGVDGGVMVNATPVITVDSAGSSGTNENLPPYYSMVFVIKITD